LPLVNDNDHELKAKFGVSVINFREMAEGVIRTPG